MRRRTGATTARLLTVLGLLAGTSAPVSAGLIKIWQLKETVEAPVLVVGRVLSIQKGDRVADGSTPWKAETLSMTAEVQILRSYVNSGEPIFGDRIRVRFMAYGPSVTSFMNGYPPPLPQIAEGKTVVLPLRQNQAPVSDPWKLTADSGMDLTIPVRDEMMGSESPPATARAFLLREIANTLSRAKPAEVSSLAGYLANQNDDLRAELMPRLEPVIGDDRQRWAEVATSLLAAQGIPRPATADLLSGKAELRAWPGRPGVFLAQGPLQKLQPSPGTDALLIQTWIRDAPFHAWGSANSLLEYADDSVTASTLREALQTNVAGASYIAWTLAHAGHPVVLPEALERALQDADSPDGDLTDLQGAAALLRDFGSDRQLIQLASLVRKYQTSNPKFYSLLWQYATEAGNPREARVLAVVLRDRRIVFDTLRYCDLAVGTLERASGQHFGASGKTEKQRDEAVTLALTWLKSQGITN